MSVLSAPVRDRRAERYAATRREILDAAWALVRLNGLASLSMRELGAQVGMRAQSLYAYFPSKFAIYDAMFTEANRELLRRLNDAPQARNPLQALRQNASVFLTFCVDDPARYQLLFQRTIPGFEPSREAFALAVDALDVARNVLRACGVVDSRAVDMWTALIAGLAAQQSANEPGGDRWVALVDDATEMFLAYYAKTKKGVKR